MRVDRPRARPGVVLGVPEGQVQVGPEAQQRGVQGNSVRRGSVLKAFRRKKRMFTAHVTMNGGVTVLALYALLFSLLKNG